MLCILNAKSIKPMCEIVLYAYSLFILNCVNPTTVPTINDNNELSNKLVVHVKLNANNDLLV